MPHNNTEINYSYYKYIKNDMLTLKTKPFVNYRYLKKSKCALARLMKIITPYVNKHECKYVQLKLKPFFIKITKIWNEKSNFKVYNDIKKRYIPKEKVYSTIKKFTKLLIPKKLFGSRQNFLIFLTQIKRYIYSQKNENIDDISEKMKINDIDFLKNIRKTNRRIVLRYMINWIFIVYIKSLILNSYHSTVISHGVKDNIIFVTRKYWSKRQKNMICTLTKNKKLIPINPENKPETNGHLLLLPKGNNFEDIRPIVVVKRSADASHKNLKFLLHKFSKEKEISNTTDFFDKWSKFVKNTSNKKLYAASIDLKSAFLLVDTDFLIDRLKQDLAAINKSDFIETFEDCMKNQILRYIQNGKRIYFKWNYGLIQGHFLSTPLFNYYRACVDKIYLSSLNFNIKEVFLYRHLDDYLFISTNEDKTLRFKEIMENNFILKKCESPINNVSFIGFNINLISRNIVTDKQTLVNNTEMTDFKSKLQYYLHNKKNVTKKIVHVCKPRSNSFFIQKAFINLSYNTLATVRKNIKLYFTIMWKKIVTVYKYTDKKKNNTKNLRSAIQYTITNYVRLMYTRLYNNKKYNEKVLHKMKIIIYKVMLNTNKNIQVENTYRLKKILKSLLYTPTQ